MIRIVYGETLRDSGGSYRKYEIEVTKEILATRANINGMFAQMRQSVTEQKDIDEKVK